MIGRFTIQFKGLIASTTVIFLIYLPQVGNCTTFSCETLNEKNPTMQEINISLYGQFSLSTYNQNVINSDRKEGLSSVSSSSYKRKSPGAVFAIAFFPGFFVHGLGHYYIGETGTGTLLLSAELLSGLVFFGAMVSGVGGSESRERQDEPRSLACLGMILFFGSWAYDFIGAPKKAEKLNKEHGYSIFIYPKIDSDQVSLNLALSIK